MDKSKENQIMSEDETNDIQKELSQFISKEINMEVDADLKTSLSNGVILGLLFKKFIPNVELKGWYKIDGPISTLSDANLKSFIKGCEKLGMKDKLLNINVFKNGTNDEIMEIVFKFFRLVISQTVVEDHSTVAIRQLLIKFDKHRRLSLTKSIEPTMKPLSMYSSRFTQGSPFSSTKKKPIQRSKEEEETLFLQLQKQIEEEDKLKKEKEIKNAASVELSTPKASTFQPSDSRGSRELGEARTTARSNEPTPSAEDSSRVQQSSDEGNKIDETPINYPAKLKAATPSKVEAVVEHADQSIRISDQFPLPSLPDDLLPSNPNELSSSDLLDPDLKLPPPSISNNPASHSSDYNDAEIRSGISRQVPHAEPAVESGKEAESGPALTTMEQEAKEMGLNPDGIQEDDTLKQFHLMDILEALEEKWKMEKTRIQLMEKPQPKQPQSQSRMAGKNKTELPTRQFVPSKTTSATPTPRHTAPLRKFAASTNASRAYQAPPKTESKPRLSVGSTSTRTSSKTTVRQTTERKPVRTKTAPVKAPVVAEKVVQQTNRSLSENEQEKPKRRRSQLVVPMVLGCSKLYSKSHQYGTAKDDMDLIPHDYDKGSKLAIPRKTVDVTLLHSQ